MQNIIADYKERQNEKKFKKNDFGSIPPVFRSKMECQTSNDTQASPQTQEEVENKNKTNEI